MASTSNSSMDNADAYQAWLSSKIFVSVALLIRLISLNSTPVDALSDILSSKEIAFSLLAWNFRYIQPTLKPVSVLKDTSESTVLANSVSLTKYTTLLSRLVIPSLPPIAVSMSTTMKTAVSVRLAM